MVSLDRLFPDDSVSVLAKLEFLNPSGSVKDRPARFIIEQGIAAGVIRPGMHLVESTSGNFGIALAMMSRLNGLKFTAVVDPNTASTNLAILKSYGARIETVDWMDDSGGYLKSRVARVQEIVAADPDTVWVNQYANSLNWKSHYDSTGLEIVEQVSAPIDYFVAAVSTAGTIMGTARRLKREYPDVKIVAVDAVGSVIFGEDPAPRRIPGIGSSRVPEILDPSLIDQVIHVSDEESVQGCLALLQEESIFAGGSSGAVVSAIAKLVPHIPYGSRLVTLLPDRGERYLDIIYDRELVLPFSRVETVQAL
jgi:cysteine synthase A